MADGAITIRGVTYASAAAAARAFGVTRAAVYAARDLGRLDAVGIGSGNAGARCRPVVICGLSFPSITAAAQAVGADKKYISHRIATGAGLGADLRTRFETLRCARHAAALARVVAAERARHARVWK
uniref:hypothetical protein n=1 Tax=Roseovarius sp. BRH_c41 TaxID=1629709 RepID=UPI000AE55047|nr:hypothetical protein [Roseovarius sp. BRH_c41]